MWVSGPLTPSIIHHPTLRLHLLYPSPYIIISLTYTPDFTALSAPPSSNWCLSILPLIFPCEEDSYIFEDFSEWERVFFLKIYQSFSIMPASACLESLLFQLRGLGIDLWISQDVTLMLCKSCSSPLTLPQMEIQGSHNIFWKNRICVHCSLRGSFETRNRLMKCVTASTVIMWWMRSFCV